MSAEGVAQRGSRGGSGAVTSALTDSRDSRRRRATPIRTDIQALRAIAVLAVVINHLWPERLPGGYVGVDIFFVVSGFLITLHLLKELETTGRLRFGQFYLRRAKRLLPAAYLVSIVGLIGTLVFLPQSRWQDAAWETLAASLYGENWVLAAKSVDYSAHNAAATTVQHYWSLSVEEQFYLVWPWLLVGVFLLAVRLGWQHRRLVMIALGVVGVSSFWYAVVYTEQARSQAYFVTTTRVWEFVAGSLLAVGLPVVLRLLGERVALRGTLQVAGLVLIGYGLVTFGQETAFPGPWAMVPVLGTVLVIAAGPTVPRFTPVWWLGWKPVQVVGDISYSLYLWHWPLIVLAPFVVARDLRLRDRVAILLVSLVLAWLTKKFVEDPGRTKLFATLSTPKLTLAFVASVAAMALLCVAALGIDLGKSQADQRVLADRAAGECFGAAALNPGADCGDPFGPADALVSGDAEAPWFEMPDCTGEGTRATCDFSDGNPEADQVWLIGDSHAEHWKAAVVSIARDQGWVLNMDMLGGCPIVDVPRASFDGGPPDPPEQQAKCLDWSVPLLSEVAAAAPDLVITSAFGSAEFIEDGSGREQGVQYADATARLAEQVLTGATRLVAIRDVPRTLDRATPECLAQTPQDPLGCANERGAALLPDPFADAVQSLGRQDATVIDLSDRFCDEARCYAVIGGVPVYFDQDHISRSYATSLIPQLQPGLDAALR